MGLLVQVFCEDVAIAILFVRFQAAIGLRRTLILVACLFAAVHIPTMMEKGASPAELASLIMDAGLGVAVLFVAQRSADVWSLWGVHFAMDMMQFYAGRDRREWLLNDSRTGPLLDVGPTTVRQMPLASRWRAVIPIDLSWAGMSGAEKRCQSGDRGR